MFSYENRCKDSLPSDTIQKARKIISSIGLITSEQWFTPVRGLYSLHLSVIGTSIYSNGKGATPEFALASAYGELLERIQNLTFYRISHYSECFIFDSSVRIAKDEKMTSKVCELPEQEKYFKMVLDKDHFEEGIAAWNSVYNDEQILNTRFKNLFNPTDEIIVPERTFSVYYGSNGMAGGNTYAEAFVQALSEIFERYAVRQIIKRKMTPPDITKYVKENFTNIGKLISEIQGYGKGISIQIKDISLGLGLPVFAAVYIDKEKNEYFVNLGSHPDVIVAIERCLTELYQGQERVKVNNATCINEMIENESRTMNSIFCTGEGAYPVQFFGKTESYSRINMSKLTFESNADMITYCTDIISKLGYKIYYQDVGFLGFPAVSVIVPGMSEAIYDPSDTITIRNSKQYLHFLRNYQSIDKLDEGALDLLAQFLENYVYSPSTSINEILRVPIDSYNNPHFDDITIDLFLSMIYIRLSKYDQAKRHMDSFINYMRINGADTYSIQYNLIISSILRCRINQMSDSDIIDCLSDYFPINEVKMCMDDIRAETVFDGLPKCTCPYCEECEYNEVCHFIKDNAIASDLLKLKVKYHEKEPMLNQIKQ